MKVKHPKPIVPRTLVAVFSVSLGLLVFYTALVSVLHSPSMYHHITNPAQQQQSAAIIGFISSPVFSANHLDFLSESEKSHMTDVKRLFDIAYIIMLCAVGIIIGIVLVFAYNKMWERLDELLSRSLRTTGWTLLAIYAVIGIASLLNFEKFWIVFHAVLFPQGNWQFSYDSILITLYPASFFETFVLRVSILITSFGAAAVILSYVMDKMRRHEAVFNRR